MPISCNTGAYKPCLSGMIEFRLSIDSRITRAVHPLISKCFTDCSKVDGPVFPSLEDFDSDFIKTWEQSLNDDFVQDRHSLARLFNDPKFAHGHIALPSEDIELVLRALTEVRLFVRESHLNDFTDDELENGEFHLANKPSVAQSYYLAYVVLAEIQEGLIARL